MNSIKHLRTVAAALALTLGIVAPTFAATSTSQVTLTVNAATTISGLAASYDFGPLDAGSQADVQLGGISVSSNANPTISASIGALSDGSHSLPASAFSVSTDDTTYSAMPNNVHTGAGDFDLWLRVDVPAAQAAGTYSGLFTLQAS